MKRFHYALITAAFAALLLSACGSADTDTAGSSGDNFLGLGSNLQCICNETG